MRSATLLCLLVLAGLLALPAAAMAAEEGVIVDPDSPAGKEYALPLESARREAAADPSVQGRKISPTAQTAPPFGVGIEPGRGGAGARGGDRPGAEADVEKASTAAAGVVTGNLSSSLTIFALSLVVLAAGGLLGFAVGRNARSGPSV